MEGRGVGVAGNLALQLGPGSILIGGVDTVKDVGMAEKRKSLNGDREREREREREKNSYLTRPIIIMHTCSYVRS